MGPSKGKKCVPAGEADSREEICIETLAVALLRNSIVTVEILLSWPQQKKYVECPLLRSSYNTVWNALQAAKVTRMPTFGTTEVHVIDLLQEGIEGEPLSYSTFLRALQLRSSLRSC
jgi:hypothetical protein